MLFAPPGQDTGAQVQVELQLAHISVTIASRTIIRGELYARIKREESTWYAEQGILYLSLLKLNRRGSYQNGCTNADTFWKSLLRKQPPGETLEVGFGAESKLSRLQPRRLLERHDMGGPKEISVHQGLSVKQLLGS